MISKRSAMSKVSLRPNTLAKVAIVLPILCAFLLPSIAQAQDAPAKAQPADAATAAPAAEDAAAEQAAPKAVDSFSVSVQLNAAANVADQAVILLAARPKGPHEPKDPTPQHQWTATTNAQGVATFENIPLTVATSGLRLHATTFQNGHLYKSPAVTPAPGIKLNIGIYEQGHTLDGVVIKDVQTIAHVWENHIFFQQFYLVSTEGDKLIDTAQLAGARFENGMPIRLPIKATGIQVESPGETRVVNSIVNWKGVLKPGENVPVSVAFSIPADHTTFTYEQEFDYPVRSAKILLPLEPTSPQVKIAYFDTVSLAAPGFKVDAVEGGLNGQNQGKFLVADNGTFEKDGVMAFQLTGLPFDEPTGAWLALILGVAGIIVALIYSRQEQRHIDKTRTSAGVAEMLRGEQKELLDELAAIEQDYEDGEVGDLEYERESLLLRGRIALVMRKIAEIEEAMASPEAPNVAA